MMVARGVFKETTTFRQQPMEPEARPAGGGGGGRRREATPLTAERKAFLRQAMEDYLRPVMRA
jgi:hypothetical protein